MVLRAFALALAALAWTGCEKDAEPKAAEDAFEAKRQAQRDREAVFNHACAHARAVFDRFDLAAVPKGQPLFPAPVTAVLDEAARSSTDPMIAEAARKYPGYRYVLTFEECDLAVPGSAVVVDIAIRDRSGQEASMKFVVTRTAAAR